MPSDISEMLLVIFACLGVFILFVFGRDRYFLRGLPSFAVGIYTRLSEGSKSGKRRKNNEYISDNPIRVAMVIGAVFSTILPLFLVIWKSVLCNYGLGDGFSGVCFVILPTVIVGAVVGNVWGKIGEGLSPLWGSILAAIGGFVVGMFTASCLLFLFPFC